MVCRITGYVSIFDFSSFIGIPIGIAGSTSGLKTFGIAARVKMYKSIMKKKKKKHD